MQSPPSRPGHGRAQPPAVTGPSAGGRRLLPPPARSPRSPPAPGRGASLAAAAVHKSLAAAPPAALTPDIAVVGSGIGGLTAAALLARAGVRVTVFEAHDAPGGAAHGFRYAGADFDAGPSFHAGLAPLPAGAVSPNPLAQALRALGESVPCVSYDTWVTHLPGAAPFKVTADGAAFRDMVRRQGGPSAAAQWARVEAAMAPLALGAASFPAAALRADVGVLATAAKFGPGLLRAGLSARTLTAPFGALLASAGVTDPWLATWLDLECFVLSGMRAKDTICAEMAFMFAERHKRVPGGGLPFDYPLGGSAALVAALVRGLTKHGGHLVLNTAVQRVLVEGGRAAGVAVAPARRAVSGRDAPPPGPPPAPTVVRSRRAVLSNASVWDTARLVRDGGGDSGARGGDRAARALRAAAGATPALPSFMHLHAVLDVSDAEGAAAAAAASEPGCGHHLLVHDFSNGAAIERPQNVVILSFPSTFDPALAPPGTLSVHAYTAGNEPHGPWARLERGSAAYAAFKEERSAILWSSLERVVPGARTRARAAAVGTPLTHARFLRRAGGSYGPGISAATGSFPGPATPLPGLYRCGDSCAPGIGVPAAAASGMIAANTLVPVWDHLELLGAIGL